MRDTEKLCIIHSLLCVRHLLKLRLLVCELLCNTILTQRFLFEHHNRFWEVRLTEIHLDSIREEWLHGHLRLSTLGFLRLHSLHISSCVSIRGFPRRLLSLIDHLLIGHSTAIFASWLCRTLSEGRKIGRVHFSNRRRELWVAFTSWHRHLMRRLSLWSLGLVLFASATLSTIVTIVGSLLIVLLILFRSTLVTTTLTMRLSHVRPSAPTNPTERHASLL